MSNHQASAYWLRKRLRSAGQSVVSECRNVSWRELAEDQSFPSFYGRCVIIRTCSQMAAARALIQLEGVARRIVLCPAELPDQQCLSVAETAEVNVVMLDQTADAAAWKAKPGITCVLLEDVLHTRNVSDGEQQDVRQPTEWILLTSGTTEAPKLVVHTFASLTCGIERAASSSSVVWSTFYDIRRYGGLQIFLRAALTGASLVLSSRQEAVAQHLLRAAAAEVTHISGTPSHWRRALMSPYASRIAPRYIRLSGEIADQAVLDQLHQQYPQAAIVHAFASTEAGVVFETVDGLAGVPVEALGQHNDVETRIEAGTLRVRSARSASRYLGPTSTPLKDREGFVNTNDVLTLKDERFFFGGRQDGVINIGGLKVHPEEVESVLNSHPKITLSLVRAKRSPLLGAVVIADVLLRGADAESREAASICREVMAFCRERLATYKVPALIRPVPLLPMADSGKLARTDA